MDEKIDKSVLRWFSHIERMENDSIAKSVCAGSRVVGRLWIDSVNDFEKE